MSEVNKENKEFTFENEQYRKTYWHTCSHILAQAVKRLHPEVKLAIGPSIDNGFYYDLDAPFAFTQDDLGEIEAEMRKICKEKLKLERFELPRAEAVKYMEEKEEPYKVELINDLPEDAHISFYKQGEFVDLCAGPHVDSTGRIKGSGIKLTTARYYTPSGECIHGVGIEPDITLELDEDAATIYGINNLPHEQDNQLQAAIKVLRGEWTEETPDETAEDDQTAASGEGADE